MSCDSKKIESQIFKILTQNGFFFKPFFSFFMHNIKLELVFCEYIYIICTIYAFIYNDMIFYEPKTPIIFAYLC